MATIPWGNSQIILRRENEPAPAEWLVHIPPRGPQDYDGDDQVGPFGDSFWSSEEAARMFIARVMAEYTPPQHRWWHRFFRRAA